MSRILPTSSRMRKCPFTRLQWRFEECEVEAKQLLRERERIRSLRGIKAYEMQVDTEKEDNWDDERTD
ncbi:hypothetical protein OS493_020123 [Desmophyllum pertusum]|uniref:Uncharacterized protein n=1 Tax=Desmophyllum pertusum TaxID=174260 RepID=A0A9X0A1H9_9CNID|nr:hypothetical protein OS493_020123 [Desmophyllum pertusum]